MGLFNNYQRWVDNGTDLDAEAERSAQRDERRADRVERHVPGNAGRTEAARLREEAANTRRGPRP